MVKRRKLTPPVLKRSNLAAASLGPRQRSPNYPAISLSDAVAKVKKVYETEGRAGAPMSVALHRMGYKSGHGPAMAAVSALRKYGLVEPSSSRIIPSQLAVDIIQFPVGHPRSDRAVREAALRPDVIRELVELYSAHGNLPSDESIRPELIADKGFNPKVADGFIKTFRETLAYAGLIDGNGVLLCGPDGARLIGAADGSSTADMTTFSEELPPGQVVMSQPVREQMVHATMHPALLAETQPRSGSGRSEEVKMRDLTIPLMDGETAFLRVPVALTEDNYEYLLEQMTVFKRGIVARPAKQASSIGPVLTTAAGITPLVADPPQSG